MLTAHSMVYSIRHLTKFHYSAPISESIMEVRMHPRTEGHQRCVSFNLTVSPAARVMQYVDFLGNIIHHFDTPGRHIDLNILMHAYVETVPPPALPESLGPDGWQALDRLVASEDQFEMLMPSQFVQSTERLRQLARELGMERRDDPLRLLKDLTASMHAIFAYKPNSTTVDSSIDDALQARAGVCQDFAHIMIALCRDLGVPCRYVSGYLFHRVGDKSRSMEDATHAWVEALLPDLGWVGFDPTNNLICAERHVRTAVGRDYADVPPTRGVYKGDALSESELNVGVRVAPATGPLSPEMLPTVPPIPASRLVATELEIQLGQQQQQQQ